MGTCDLTMPPRCRWDGVGRGSSHPATLTGFLTVRNWLDGWAGTMAGVPGIGTKYTGNTDPGRPGPIRWPASSTTKPPVPNIATGLISGGQSPLHCSWPAPNSQGKARIDT